jgi:hypothetical protein
MMPVPAYQALVQEAQKRSPAAPATSPPTWYIQMDREALYNIYRGKPPAANAARSVGGFYANLDNQYLRTILNRKLGKVFVVRGKAPTTPHTLNGEHHAMLMHQARVCRL